MTPLYVSRSSFAICSLGLLTFFLFAPQLVFATDISWTGATNTTWGTGSNWTGGSTPGGGDNARFNSTFSNQPNLTSTTTVGGIWMTGSIGQNVTISASSSTLGLDSNTINGTAGLGVLVDNANAFTLTITAPLQLNNDQTWRNNSGNLLTIGAGGVNTNSHALTINGTGNTTVTGVISDSGTLTKAGSGTLTVSGANTYTGATTVNTGSLFVNNTTGSGTGTGNVSVNGGTLGGSGRISGNVTVASGANLSPGATGAGSTAILHTGNLTLSSGANFTLDLNNTTAGTGYDQVSVTGTVNISGSTLVLNPGAGLTVGNKFFIVANDSTDAVTGMFSQGTTITSGNDTFLINYADNFDGGSVANDISLTLTAVLPEPGNYVVGIFGLGVVGLSTATRLGRLLRKEKWSSDK